MTVEPLVEQKIDSLEDQLGRTLNSLRISVIDRCDLRCNYCMPEEDYAWFPRTDILSFAEIEGAVDAFTQVGVSKLRLTGGEPLLRPNLVELVERLARNPRIEDLAMTTNGSLFARRDKAISWGTPGIAIKGDSTPSSRRR